MANKLVALWIMAFWKLMCIPSVSAQPCSNDAKLLLEAPWAQQVGWNLSVATSNWTGVSCNGAFVSQVYETWPLEFIKSVPQGSDMQT